MRVGRSDDRVGCLQRRGMTLVEVLVAAVLLGVGVAGLLSAASLSMRNQQRSEQRSVGLALAQEKMAEVELLGADNWLVGRPGEGVEDRSGVTYTWTTQIEQQQTLGPLYHVVVDVSWSTPSGGDGVQIQTLLNSYGGTADQARQEQQASGKDQTNAPSR
ncbi:MAG: prepilin-type N-terminal cleavage/methylation domain-containing protein [Planctomycetes bacterium]|nr:prepilin-type N-terminal cleavage/methylation domain-containing protein [Planctomycetota bacterium]